MKEKRCDRKNCRFLLCFIVCIAALFLANPAYAGEEGAEQQEGQVSGLVAENQTVKSIRLKWEGIEGAQGYTLYQYNDKDKSWKEVKNLQQNYFEVRKLKPATVYQFRVAAYRSAGFETVYLPVSETLTTATVPQKTSVEVTQAGFYLSNYHLRLLICRAKKVKGASGYQYAYSLFRNKKYRTIRTKKWFSKIRLQKGRTYYFKVRAYKKAGDVYYYGEYSDPKPVWIQ